MYSYARGMLDAHLNKCLFQSCKPPPDGLPLLGSVTTLAALTLTPNTLIQTGNPTGSWATNNQPKMLTAR